MGKERVSIFALSDSISLINVAYSVGDTKFGFLHDSYREGDHWQVHGIYDTYNTSIPHLACELVAETMVDDRLLNGEILCATAYMAIRLRDKSYSAHRIAPVCCIPSLASFQLH